MDKVILQLKAKHFRDTEYTDNCNCAIAKAAKEQFKTEDVSEVVDHIEVDGVVYTHKSYDPIDFLEDEMAAETMLGETVIREIILRKMERETEV